MCDATPFSTRNNHTKVQGNLLSPGMVPESLFRDICSKKLIQASQTVSTKTLQESTHVQQTALPTINSLTFLRFATSGASVPLNLLFVRCSFSSELSAKSFGGIVPWNRLWDKSKRFKLERSPISDGRLPLIAVVDKSSIFIENCKNTYTFACECNQKLW